MVELCFDVDDGLSFGGDETQGVFIEGELVEHVLAPLAGAGGDGVGVEEVEVVQGGPVEVLVGVGHDQFDQLFEVVVDGFDSFVAESALLQFQGDALHVDATLVQPVRRGQTFDLLEDFLPVNEEAVHLSRGRSTIC